MPARLRPWIARRRYAAPAPPEEAEPAPPPHPGRLRRERRMLGRRREREIRDLGGLLLEMVRRDRFREPLLLERSAEILALEQRMHELDALMASALAAARGPAVPLCACGAPLPPGSHFCAHCGRPGPGPAVVACRHCGQPLPADANFCAFCGRSAAAEDG